MSQNLSLKVAPSNKDDYLECPFDERHLIMRSRMTVHLVRCAPNHHGSRKVRCPFNNTHIDTISKMKIHVGTCPERAGFEKFVHQNEIEEPDELPYEKREEIECSEDWDKEPDVGTYNPKLYCDKKFLILNPQGNPPAVKRQIRESERKRFQQHQKF
ncbi:gametocyte-specific factor 1 homolog [Drosophila pseudoobscura]|uniref:Gametocyte-specific factor 1 homolog n=1 Tax=Drosophila pseudoobscura pseudoobscura TaxID=46245 RepID=A0A6I8UZ29_DROPS|nr:gametocyte-specific factor 1 homolog [Drosophila pseudoobscura]